MLVVLIYLNLGSTSDLVSFTSNSTSPNGRFVVEQLDSDIVVHDLLYRRNSARYFGHDAKIRRIAWEPNSLFFLTVSADRYANLYSVGGGDHTSPYAQFLHDEPVLDAYCYDNEFYTLTLDGYGYRWFINGTGAFGETPEAWGGDHHSKVLSHQFIPETKTLMVFYQDGAMCRQEFASGSRQCYVPQVDLGELGSEESEESGAAINMFAKASVVPGVKKVNAEILRQPKQYMDRQCLCKGSLDNFVMGFLVGAGAIIAILYDLFDDVKHALIPRTMYVMALLLAILKQELLLEHPLLVFTVALILVNPSLLRSLTA